MKPLPIILLLLLCEGCATTSTVTPNLPQSSEASYDATTPPQYDAKNSGILFQTKDSRDEFDGVVLTEGGRDFYYVLIRSYAVQYKAEHGLDLAKESGVKAWRDLHENNLWWLDNQRFAAYLTMSGWLKARRDPDSIWLKTKNLIAP